MQSRANCTLSPPLDRRSEEPSDSACVRALGENCFSRAQMFEEARFLKCEAHAGGQWELAAPHLGACRLDWNFGSGTAGPMAYSRDRAGSHWGMIQRGIQHCTAKVLCRTSAYSTAKCRNGFENGGMRQVVEAQRGGPRGPRPGSVGSWRRSARGGDTTADRQNFGKMLLVFGFIGSDFCKKICVLQHFSKSTRF